MANDPTADKNGATTSGGKTATTTKSTNKVDVTTAKPGDTPSTTNTVDVDTAKDEPVPETKTIRVPNPTPEPLDKSTEVAEAKQLAEANKDDGSQMNGDLAQDQSVKDKIVENKNGETIAYAPTADSDMRTVTVEDAMRATALGRPIPGAELKPDERPDIQVTTKEDILRTHATLGDDISNGSVTKKGGDTLSLEDRASYYPRTKVIVTSGPAADMAEEAARAVEVTQPSAESGDSKKTEATKTVTVKS